MNRMNKVRRDEQSQHRTGKRHISMKTQGSTINRLRALVHEARQANPHLTSRLEKGAFLMVFRSIEPLGENTFRIGSEDGLRSYRVINGHCECSDYLRHGPGHPCKHRIALDLYLRLEADEALSS